MQGISKYIYGVLVIENFDFLDVSLDLPSRLDLVRLANTQALFRLI